ncbi:MAG: hypothetical protein ACAI35_06955 [Candidatus Methylacidiphilales bacterium]|nr:hypothetical protein [Candidatus Methylacidiphilales bacterium]
MKNLKSKMLALVMALSLASSVSIYTAHAEDAPADKPKGPRGGHHGGFEHWKKMADELQLTPEQREKIKEILKAKFKETKEEIEAVLTAEQRVKLEEKKAEWKAKHKGGPRGAKTDKPAA